MRKATKKELKTIKEVFRVKYVKVLFEKLYIKGLITKKEYELSIKKCDEEIEKIIAKGGLKWKKEK